VTQGYAAVVGAKVIATIEYPDATQHAKTQLELRDDGVGVDILKGDGTYSAYLINSNAKGKHSINVEVVSVGGTSVKSVSYSQAGAISEPGEPISVQEVDLTPTDEFQRFSLAGFIDVQSIAPPNVDRYAPSRVQDLNVTGASYADGTVTLEWTAVGDDLDVGTAESYEVWRADSHKIMYRERVASATLVKQSDLDTGSLTSPKPANQRERIVLTIPDKSKTYVYAILVKDDSNNLSEMSNVVSAKLVEVPSAVDVGLIAGVTVGVLVLVLIIVIVGVLLAKGTIGPGRASKVIDSPTHKNKAYLA